MRFGKGDWTSFEKGIEREWLVTNGLGGYSSSTIIGANTRKYHGLLVAALSPPVQRTVLLAKLDERLESAGITYNLAANQTAGGVSEFGFIHLQQAKLDYFPRFIYSFSDKYIEKTVFMVYGQNTTVVLYRVYNGTRPAVLKLTPLVTCRDFHWTSSAGHLYFRQHNISRGVALQAVPEVPTLKLMSSEGEFRPSGDWYQNIFYAAEQERGLNPSEDLYIPGQFVVNLTPGEEKIITVVATIEEGTPSLDGPALLDAQSMRLEKLVQQAGYEDPLARRLVLSSDAFVVHRRSTANKSVIAGYPWFNDWGRDTMIALPGLTLVTKRYDDARQILLTFARHCKDGLLPNMFTDSPDQEPLYNTVDASLWYFWAVYKYLQYTGDFSFIRDEIYPVLKEIIEHHVQGTHFNIKAGVDGLLSAGSRGTQLTWMDAKVGDWVVTPRQGKPVEINALWYNALCTLEYLAGRFGDAFAYSELPEKIRKSFRQEFWFEEGGYLYDVIGTDGADGISGKDTKLRPNQVIAFSLPFTALKPEFGRQVIRRVWRRLYATYGLRSLSPHDPDYRGVYIGDQVKRDGAYHQGTTWSWLMGPFVTAYRQVHGYSPASRVQAEKFIEPFQDHLRHHGLGYISEIFDGNEPIIPRGCIAQAWGVAEVLRAYVEDVLEIRPLGLNAAEYSAEYIKS